ncbi:MAG: carboxypeptidase-like regulatory domain-containing protein [Terriglobales bacterium]
MLVVALSAAGQQQLAPPPPLGRSVHGVVMDAHNRPLASAIVDLQDMKTKAIRSVVTAANGQFVFHQLKPNVSYEVFAVWRKHRSPVRTDSQYWVAMDLRLDLVIPVG